MSWDGSLDVSPRKNLSPGESSTVRPVDMTMNLRTEPSTIWMAETFFPLVMSLLRLESVLVDKYDSTTPLGSVTGGNRLVMPLFGLVCWAVQRLKPAPEATDVEKPRKELLGFCFLE